MRILKAINLIPQVVTTLIILTQAGIAYGEAYCALRDPISSIQKLFPDATNYRSIVKTIGEDVRAEVHQILPPNTLHFGELGRHTLYVPVQGKKPLGFVHVRSEESQWGLVEIAWAMDLDLRIIDFSFQRCRNRNKYLLESDQFKQQIIGKNFSALRKLVDQNGLGFDSEKVSIPDGAGDLANVLIRCGLKTLLVTQLAWQDDIREIALGKKARDYFSNVSVVSVVDRPYDEALTQELNTSLGAKFVGIDRTNAMVVKAHDEDESLVGLLFKSRTKVNDEMVDILWAISPEKRLVNVEFPGIEPAPRERAQFESLVGQIVSDNKQCHTRADLMTYEATFVATFQQ